MSFLVFRSIVPGGPKCVCLAGLARGLRALASSLEHHHTSEFEVAAVQIVMESNIFQVINSCQYCKLEFCQVIQHFLSTEY